MIQGIYTASQGMTSLADKQDQIANNLANIQTTGFKQSSLFTTTFQKCLANDQQQPFVNSEIRPDEVHVDYSEGNMIKTGSPMDVFIKGSGFLTIMTPDGIRYTRNGNLSLNAEGLIVTSDGSKVMGKNGFIRVDQDTGGPVSINDYGEVIQDADVKGVLRVADFKKPYKLLREGNSYFKPQEPDNPVVESQGFAIKQGYLEGSNVNIIKNMVDMISAYRNFEADQKAVASQDETLQKAIEEVGKVS
ncbi:MAG: flagellar basal-body rod protein FlgF [Chitinivibrionales bacterium]